MDKQVQECLVCDYKSVPFLPLPHPSTLVTAIHYGFGIGSLPCEYLLLWVIEMFGCHLISSVLVMTHQLCTVVNAHHRISKVIWLNLAATMHTDNLSEAHIIRSSFHIAYKIYSVWSAVHTSPCTIPQSLCGFLEFHQYF